MRAPLYSLPGAARAPAPGGGEPPADPPAGPDAAPAPPRCVAEVLAHTRVQDELQALDAALVGLQPVKARVRDLAALLVVDRLRAAHGLVTRPPSLHMCFTGPPGTGKTTVAQRMAGLLHRLGHVRQGQLVAVTRDDLVGAYIGHTGPKTREVIRKALGGVLFIDEAYTLYRPENERDYGLEALEILLQAMENQRHDLVVILAGYAEGMATFFRANPGLSSRIAHHVEFPDYAPQELLQIADRLLDEQGYRFGEGARATFAHYLALRLRQPHFANARSVRNALDRARLRQASRLFSQPHTPWDTRALGTLEAADFAASRVFRWAEATAPQAPPP
ncbi:AAA family ATPase [Ideonella livida]|uniref:AAA family ATPase n=1 Tax=Ideonella livida TaxID=2707176 RepID=A0A7C9PKN3_9BURK|nr:AAA family ATPase [Ideonella livida]NDY93550.1 AAA family ATPase [Ideonella livida]